MGCSGDVESGRAELSGFRAAIAKIWHIGGLWWPRDKWNGLVFAHMCICCDLCVHLFPVMCPHLLLIVCHSPVSNHTLFVWLPLSHLVC